MDTRVFLLLHISLMMIVSCSANINIKSTLELKKIEKIYLKSILSSSLVKNSICSLTKELKITLCKRIFETIPYKDLNIHPNDIAFFLHTLKCVRKQVILRTKILFSEEIIMQEMYPCYGKHDPIRTNYKIDDYYDKFYISASLLENSVMVYILQCNEQSTYTVYNYLENIEISKLSSVSTNIKHIQNELQEPQQLYWSYKREQIEYIYINEYYHTIDDPICGLPVNKKQALCQLIFEQYTYKMFFWITLNKAAFYIFNNKGCSKQRVKLCNSKYRKYSTVMQVMFTCFARNRLLHGNVFYDKSSMKFAISKGPRDNSVLVYIRRYDGKKVEYYLFSLIENVYIENLKPLNIDKNDVHEEDLNSLHFLKKLNSTSKAWRSAVQMKADIATKIANYHLQNRCSQVLNQSGISEKQYTKIHSCYNSVTFQILSLISNEVTYIDLNNRYEESETILLPQRTLFQKILNLIHNLRKIISTSDIKENMITKEILSKLAEFTGENAEYYEELVSQKNNK